MGITGAGMFNFFSNRSDETSKSAAGGEPHWPLARIEAGLTAEYGRVERPPSQASDGPVAWFACEHRNLRFLVGAMQKTPGSGHVVELGFFSVFQGLDFTQAQIDALNGALNIAVVSREPDNNIYLMAGLTVTGPFTDTTFSAVLQTWNRDMVVAIHHMSPQHASLAQAFLIREAGEAFNFAVNQVPTPDATNPAADATASSDLFSRFISAAPTPEILCTECNGRGKRGLLARICDICNGAGMVRGA